MRRSGVVLVLALALVLGAREARAQIPNCGSAVTIDSNLWQAGYQLYLWADFQTVAPISGCLFEVQAEGWIEGTGGAASSRQPRYAYVKIGRPVPWYGRWESTGKHWIIHFLGLQWEFRGETHRQVDMVAPAVAGGGSGSGSCPGPEYQGDDSRAGNGCDSPVIVDTADDGFALTSVRRGVTFDLDADGTPERVAWTAPDSDDAWLALDRNGNGIIDNGTELFGNHTPAYADVLDPVAEHGFSALRFTEGPSYGTPSLTDDRIDASDAVFNRLLLWTDRNHNGFSEADELTSVSDSRLAAISTEFRESRRRDRYGNQFRLRGKSWWTDGSMHPIYDVWLLKRDLPGSTDDEP
jgi:hypothetical protein